MSGVPRLADALASVSPLDHGTPVGPLFDEWDLVELLFGRIEEAEEAPTYPDREPRAVYSLVRRVDHVRVRRLLGDDGEGGEVSDRYVLVPVAGRTTEQVAEAVLAAAARIEAGEDAASPVAAPDPSPSPTRERMEALLAGEMDDESRAILHLALAHEPLRHFAAFVATVQPKPGSEAEALRLLVGQADRTLSLDSVVRADPSPDHRPAQAGA